MAVKCPFPDCVFATPADINPTVAAAVLSTHAIIHSQTPRAKPVPVRRPEISAGGTTEGWTYFLTRWRAYSQAVHLSPADASIQLLECLDTKLRRDVTRNAVGPLPIEDTPEADLLAAIKALAVREENPKVARVALSRMMQDRGEPIRSFAARLRGQAEVCRFVKKCSGCNAVSNQGEERVADQLCIGLADAEIQEDLLKCTNQSMTVEETIRFVEVRAAGKRSAMTITTPTMASAIDDGEEALTSGYRRQQRHPTPKGANQTSKITTTRPRNPPRPNPHKDHTPPDISSKLHVNPRATCCFCGQRGHVKQERTAVRRVHCPAYGTTCSTCGKSNHTPQMCWQNMAENESAVFEELDTMSEGALPHQSWDHMEQRWTQRRSPPQPLIDVVISTHRSDYRTHGHTLRHETPHLITTAMADTGCQSCLAGPKLMRALHLTDDDLIPACLIMHSASGTNMPILGAALTRITTQSTGRQTRQMLYFSPIATKLYLSLATCTDLGLIPTGFPLCTPTPPPGNGTDTQATPDQPPCLRNNQMVSQQLPDIPHRSCSCPDRAPPPPRPTSLPFPATEENRDRLERHLLDLYAASAFNVCEHQPLPMMSGPPLQLNIDPNAIPKPCHTPIDIPIHWREEVKAGLDRDVRLGVLEKVPLGTPVTWCHRMVICAKKNGSLRRTINFQPLNQHATRETHHCASPFHQARAVPGNTKKTIFDAWNGYHSVALAENDRHFTTFITPWGRTGTAPPHRDISHPGTPTPLAMMPSSRTYNPRPNALMMHSFGLRTSPRPSIRQQNGWRSVQRTASP